MRIRLNEAIAASPLRVLGPNKQPLGIMPQSEALALAKNHGLDLLEISPTAKPPVCIITEYGKYIYEQSKKQVHDHKTKVKEINVTLRIAEHDLLTKVKHAEEILLKGDKIRLTLTLFGRDHDFAARAFEVVNRIAAQLEHVCAKDSPPKRYGRTIQVMLGPLPEQKREPKYTL